MATIVRVFDHDDLELPANLTVEETRRALEPLGFAGLATATASTSVEGDNTVITFSRPRGGEKGSR